MYIWRYTKLQIMHNENFFFDFDDLLIEPAHRTPIKSRKEVNPKRASGWMPLMTAPMDTVVTRENAFKFLKHWIVPVEPRMHNPQISHVSTDKVFYSYSLEDFERIFLSNGKIYYVSDTTPVYALIDIANGHMEELYRIARTAKKLYKNSMILMIGNIANPIAFEDYARLDVDYIRIGIGNGNGCLTTVQTGIGYPIASLIHKCREIKDFHHYKTRIVADGGFKKYSDIIKGLALGADYVMLGSIFNKALESAGETTKEDGTVIDQYTPEAKEMFNSDIPLYKTFRGMSTKEVQRDWGIDDLKTSEGVVRRNRVEYTLEGWVQNFDSYLRSAMSYTGKKELRDFIGGVHWNLITQNSFNRFNK